ncbi:MAG: phenylalanine--tRNA ligase beta subunit-related protein [Thermoanaerobaculia bacterium]
MSAPLRVDPALFTRYPGVLIGVVEVRGIDNATPRPELTEALRGAERAARDRLGATPVAEHERIAPWREAYRAFGAKPSKYRSSIEALARRVLAGDELPSINPLVDLYNRVSLEHLLPAGGEDLAAISGTVELRFAGEGEPAVELLGAAEAEPPVPGEVIYADEIGAVCRRWNWREAARTRLTARTRDALLVVEALPPAGRPQLEAALAELTGSVERLLGGATARTVLEADSPR